MVDFQYLPMAKKEDGSYVDISENLFINELKKRSWVEESDAKLFLPPSIFSRIDNPIEYAFRDTAKARGENSTNQQHGKPSNLIGVCEYKTLALRYNVIIINIILI